MINLFSSARTGRVTFILCSLFFSIIITVTSSCKKDEVTTLPMASITVANAVVNTPTVYLNSRANFISANSSSIIPLTSGDNHLYVWPTGDSSSPYYNNPKFYAEERGLYSLFLAGIKPNITGMIVKDNLPVHKDSTGGIRFVNLSPDSPPLYINLTTTPTVKEVSNLEYLKYTDFVIYPAKSSNTSYTFEFRKMSDNSKVASLTLSPVPRFTNVTLFLRGLLGNSSVGVSRINNER